MKKLIPLAVLIATLATACSAQAQDEIAVAFGTNGNSLYTTPTSLGVVTPIAIADWNQETGSSGSLLHLGDNSGGDSGATLSFSAGGVYGTGNNNLNNLYANLIYTDNGNITFTVNDLSYANYDVYVFVGNSGSNLANNSGTIGTETLKFQTTSYHESSFLINSDPTNPGTTIANTLEFTGLTGSSFTYTQPDGYGATSNSISGFEIVEVAAAPEPSTWAMMFGGIACLAFYVRRRAAQV